jgi:hypothetical protein
MQVRDRWGWVVLLGLMVGLWIQQATAAPFEALNEEQKKWFLEGKATFKTLTPERKYFLPFPAGSTHAVIESWFDERTHADAENAYAWDFAFGTNDVIAAARTGTVFQVIDNQGEGPNKICIRHSDGEVSVYAHIRDGGSLVKQGDKVNVGDPLGYCGPQLKHLHYTVWFWSKETGNTSIPTAFRDYNKTNGVPHMGAKCKSSNQRVNASMISKFNKAIEAAEKAKAEGNPGKALKALAGCDIEIWSDELDRAKKVRGELDAEAKADFDAAEKLVADGQYDEAEAAYKAIQKKWKGTDYQDKAKDDWKTISRSKAYKEWKKSS